MKKMYNYIFKICPYFLQAYYIPLLYHDVTKWEKLEKKEKYDNNNSS